MTDIDEDKRGAALILNMSGRALDIALAVDPDKVSSKEVIALMDNVYVEDNDLSMKCDEFDRLLRRQDQNMKEFIHIYEQKINELKAGKVVLPDIVLATKILRAANLLPNHYLIARSSCSTMTFANAKDALLRITEKCPGMNAVKGERTDMIQVKEEPMDYDQPITMYNETGYGIHNVHNGNETEKNDIFYQSGSQNRRPYVNRNSANKQCYGCGESNHWIKDCPSVHPNKGNNRKCYGCGDITHWIKDCPHLRDLQALVKSLGSKPMSYAPRNNQNSRNYRGRSNEKESFYAEDENCNVSPENDGNFHYSQEETNNGQEKQVFFQSDVGNEVEDILLVGETVNKAVLDSGASKTVCGKEWYDCYIESVDENTKKDLKEFPSDTVFRFGVGKLRALKMVHLPVKLCEKQIKLEVHVVETDIPLLLSLKTMKTMGMQINFEQDKVAVDGQMFDLETTSSGHYAFSLSSNSPEIYANTVSDCVNEANIDMKKKALKLHRRFAHASSSRIIKLMRNAGKSNKELEKELEILQKSCDFCLKHQRASPRPTVCLPLANQFNELIAMDLKLIKGKWVLHCIDYLTRFSAAHVVKSKDPNEIIEKFFMIWVSIFGPPQRILSDNGGEFQGEKWEPICEAFNIVQRSTATEAPFSNGVCERHNLLIGEMTEKIIEDVDCSLQTALMWAVHAKNSLINIYGFSPYQLVFGYNPRIPGNSSNKLPALSSETANHIVADHLNSLRTARLAYIKAENSDQIARALRGRVYEGTHKRFCSGDTVYYKRLKMKNWQGPGKVIAQDGSQVLVKSGSGRLVKVHPCKLVLKRVADDKLVNNNVTCLKANKDRRPRKNDTSSESDSESGDDTEKVSEEEKVSEVSEVERVNEVLGEVSVSEACEEVNVTDDTREVIEESNQQKTIRITDNPIERRTDAETKKKKKEKGINC